MASVFILMRDKERKMREQAAQRARDDALFIRYVLNKFDVSKTKTLLFEEVRAWLKTVAVTQLTVHASFRGSELNKNFPGYSDAISTLRKKNSESGDGSCPEEEISAAPEHVEVEDDEVEWVIMMAMEQREKGSFRRHVVDKSLKIKDIQLKPSEFEGALQAWLSYLHNKPMLDAIVRCYAGPSRAATPDDGKRAATAAAADLTAAAVADAVNAPRNGRRRSHSADVSPLFNGAGSAPGSRRRLSEDPSGGADGGVQADGEGWADAAPAARGASGGGGGGGGGGAAGATPPSTARRRPHSADINLDRAAIKGILTDLNDGEPLADSDVDWVFDEAKAMPQSPGISKPELIKVLSLWYIRPTAAAAAAAAESPTPSDEEMAAADAAGDNPPERAAPAAGGGGGNSDHLAAGGKTPAGRKAEISPPAGAKGAKGVEFAPVAEKSSGGACSGGTCAVS